MPSDPQLCGRATPEKTGVTLASIVSLSSLPPAWWSWYLWLITNKCSHPFLSCCSHQFQYPQAHSCKSVWLYEEPLQHLALYSPICVTDQTPRHHQSESWKLACLGAVLGFRSSCLWQPTGLERSRGVVSFLTWTNFYHFVRKMCHLGRTETYMKTLLYENRGKILANLSVSFSLSAYRCFQACELNLYH